MRVAHISFEYPPDTADGGIATYVYQVSQLLRQLGHDVEVFSASPTRTVSEFFEGILVHRVVADRVEFRSKVVSIFQERHGVKEFDIIESPEYGADGYEVKVKYPTLPLVVKLHTPNFLIHKLSNFYSKIPFYTKFRFIVGGLVRGEMRKPYWSWISKQNDIEYRICELANSIHTPSISLGKIVSHKWGISKQKIRHVPYPFLPNENFLKISIGTNFNTFTFIGRLEIRKGIIELVKAAKIILATVPNCRFNLVGRTQQSHIPGLSMRAYIEEELNQYLGRVNFLEVEAAAIPAVLAQTDVCVYPSLWENFPNVCLEAMSAGRAIVGSIEGGMKDMLEFPKSGLLVRPTDAKEIALAVITLLQNNSLREQLGSAARDKVLNAYSKETIGKLIEAEYARVIKEIPF